jgi:lipopolysaccharide export system protein LptA
MQRLARIAGSFAIVLIVYWVYARAAVPWIEPSVRAAGGDSDGSPRIEPQVGTEAYLSEVKGLFKPDAWEVDAKNPPMVLDISNRAKLLLQKYEPLGDGRVKLTPCTMIFFYDGSATSEEERLRQSIVLESPEGAIIKFDAPLDSTNLTIGRPVGGELLGNISIRSEGKSLGPEDDLRIHARQIVWNGQDATSAFPVDFQWGKNVGSGSGLHIKLARRDPNAAAQPGPDVGGIELFEMKQIDRLHIEGDPNKASTAAGGPAAANPNPLTSATDNGPIDITCKGPFRFNLPGRVASFENHVAVKQVNRSGQPANQLLGDKLSMYFVPRDKDAAADPNTSNLEPERIEAQGKPVTLAAPGALPKDSVYAQGERLSYNLKTKLVELDGGAEVYLKQGENEIHGKSLKYLQDPAKGPKALGSAQVRGPGWVRAISEDRPGERLEARWNGELNLGPKDGFQVISLTGGAVLDYSGLGKMSADSIYFWLFENLQADSSSRQRIKPVKMLARSNVMLDMNAKPNDAGEATQVNGAFDELKVWFEQKDAPGGIRVETGRPANSQGGVEKAQGGVPSTNEGPRMNLPVQGVSYEGSRSVPQNVPPNVIAPAHYLGQQIQPQQRAAFRQPLVQPPAAQPAAQPAIVRPMDAFPADPKVSVGGRSGVVSNPYLSGGPATGVPNGVGPNPPPYPSTPEQGGGSVLAPVVRQQRFAIRGGTLEAKVLLVDEKTSPELTDLVITGNVRLEETQTREPNEKPLVITGDKVEVVGVGTRLPGSPAGHGEYKITVLGQPALVVGHGLTLNGTNINLDQHANRLWIDGPGNMDLPMPDRLNGQPVPVPGTMNVKWRQGMNFDGLTASFNDQVEANSPTRHVRTQNLRVTLTERVSFLDADLQNRKRDAARLSCAGGVYLETNETDDKQQRTYIRMQVVDLEFDLQSGELAAGGPGWLNTVRPDDGSLLQDGRGFVPIHAPAPPPGSAIGAVVQPLPSFTLLGMHVRFEGAIAGNLNPNYQRIIFNDHVRLLYAPVDDYAAMLNPDKTEPLAANEFMLKCDNLEVRNSIDAAKKTNAAEMDARGNSVVYGVVSNAREKEVRYTARAMRISYNTAKDQLILEGDGRADVHLYRQLQLGAPWDDTAVKKIIYYPKTNTLSTEGVQTLQINRLTAPANAPDPRHPRGRPTP